MWTRIQQIDSGYMDCIIQFPLTSNTERNPNNLDRDPLHEYGIDLIIGQSTNHTILPPPQIINTWNIQNIKHTVIHEFTNNRSRNKITNRIHLGTQHPLKNTDLNTLKKINRILPTLQLNQTHKQNQNSHN